MTLIARRSAEQKMLDQRGEVRARRLTIQRAVDPAQRPRAPTEGSAASRRSCGLLGVEPLKA
jgi:hypothetical protein